MQRLFTTDRDNLFLFAQRLALAAVIAPHGAQKLLGWLGGFGFSGTMGFFTGTLGIPAPIALLVILGESIGPILLALGLFSRVSALGITAIMIGAILTTHLQHGFFMNWFGSQGGEGFEYHLLALALSIPILAAGGGKHAIDSWVAERLARARTSAAVA